MHVGTHHFYPKELLGVVEASLQQLGQVVVLRGADESRDRCASEGTTTSVEVVQ